MIKGNNNGNRRSSSSGYSADLLVCFPSRAHLALTPKSICSPSRPSDSSINRRPHHRRQLSKLSSNGGGHSSPALWAKQASSKNMGSDEIAEPTSPKVTCAGQIKVRPSKCGRGRGKNWQSMMQEIERIHENRTQSKFFGLKKDVMGFLTCLRNIRFDFRCFGDFKHVDVTSDDEEDDDEEEEEEEEEEENSKNVFSKWFMVLQEEQSKNDDDDDDDKNNNKCVDDDKKCDHENADAEPAVPPPNALLLMRCRSAPAKSWLEDRMKAKTEEENRGKEEEETEDEEASVKKKKKDLRSLMEEEKMELVLMRYDTEFYRLSSDIAKETWVVGGIPDSLSRSRSLKC